VSTPTAPGFWWKVFAGGAALWLAGTVALYVGDPSVVSVASVADLVISLFFLLGILGYAFQRRFLAPVWWRFSVPLAPVWDVVYPVVLLPETPPVASSYVVAVVGVLLTSVAIPKYVALFRYAYRSRDLWAGTSVIAYRH
jgi:hypothetical protein